MKKLEPLAYEFGPKTKSPLDKSKPGITRDPARLTGSYVIKSELFRASDILPLISEVTENAVNYTNNTIRVEAQSSIEEQEKALEHLVNGDVETARDVLLDNIKYMNEREELWKIHMEEVGDEAASRVKRSRTE